MKKNNPLVSVIIPVYNGADYVAKAIESAIKQTYPNIEIIIVDDGSTDETERIARSFGKRVTYYKKQNGGVSSALNYGIKKMNGDYFSWLSHDDMYLPEKIETEIKAIKKPNEPSIVFSNFHIIDENDNIIATTHFEKTYESNLLEQDIYPAIRGCVNGDTVLIHREIFKKCGLFDESLETSGDSDLWLRIFPFFKHYFVEAPLIQYRVHPNQGTQTHPRYMQQSDEIAIKKIKTLKPSHAKKWGCSLFRLYVELYIQFKKANLPKSTKLAYKLAEKSHKKEQPYFSIILPSATDDVVETLENSNFGDFNVYLSNKQLIPNDFRFKYASKRNLSKKSFLQSIAKKTCNNTVVKIEKGTKIDVDWAFRKYNEAIKYTNPTTFSFFSEHDSTKHLPIRKTIGSLKRHGIILIKRTIKKALGLIQKTRQKIPIKRLTAKNTIFYSTTDNNNLINGVTSLLSIRKHIPKAKLCIISNHISKQNRHLLKENAIDYVDIDLRGLFTRHWEYPVESFYLFAGPSLFYEQGIKYSVYIDSDILCCKNPIKDVFGITDIAGTTVGNCQGVFLKDYEVLKSLFKLTEEQTTRKRIASGVVYFNNKKMKKIDLLGKASKMFKKCLGNHVPRKGDDSLFTLLQLLFIPKNRIKDLGQYYNFMPSLFGEKISNKVIFLHFGGAYKPWFIYNSSNKPTNLKKHAQNWLAIQTKITSNTNKQLLKVNYPIKANYSLYERKKYLKNKTKPPLKIYVSEDSHLGIFNFGDELPKDLIPKIFGYRIQPSMDINNVNLLSVGSVMFALSDLNKTGTLSCWGSGFISEEKIPDEKELLKRVSFSAVRGKLTLARVQKSLPRKNLILGDPGILASIIYPENKHKHDKIGVIPHYIDADNETVEKLRRDPRFFVIDPLDPPAKVAYEISSCKHILSSSLHGLIFADSYGIPNAHVSFSNKVYGGEYKFKDYDSAFNKKHLDADVSQIFNDAYLKQLFKKYQPINNLEKKQKELIESFPF